MSLINNESFFVVSKQNPTCLSDGGGGDWVLDGDLKLDNSCQNDAEMECPHSVVHDKC